MPKQQADIADSGREPNAGETELRQQPADPAEFEQYDFLEGAEVPKQPADRVGRQQQSRLDYIVA